MVEQVNQIEPAEGCGRNELAELVAVSVDAEAIPETTDVTDPAWGQVHMNVTSDPIWDHGTDSTEKDVDGITGLTTHTGQKTDCDQLYHYHEAYSTAFSDTTNQYAGGANGNGDRWLMPFRDVFGQGPVYDRHDNIYWHAYIDTNGSAAGEFAEEATFYWLIHEER